MTAAYLAAQPGRCRACSTWMEPLPRQDEFGHLRGWTPHGRCLNPDCVLAYAVQPWSVVPANRAAQFGAEVARLGGVLTSAAG